MITTVLRIVRLKVKSWLGFRMNIRSKAINCFRSVPAELSHLTSRRRRSSQTTWWTLYGTIRSCSTPSTLWEGDLWWFGPMLTTNTRPWLWTRSWLLTATTKCFSWAQVCLAGHIYVFMLGDVCLGEWWRSTQIHYPFSNSTGKIPT